MLINVYETIICWLIVILSVNAYMLRDGDFVGDCIYAKWMMMMWWWLLIELWLDWLCGREYLIMQLLLKLINVNRGVLLHCCWWIYMLKILHYWVFACMSIHHSHMRNVKGGVLLHRWIVRGGVLLHKMFCWHLVAGDGTACI